MGLIVSCPRRAKVVNPGVIRVVHLNGQVDKFPSPVSLKRVLQHHPRHFICHSRDLYAVNGRPLQTAEELRLGELYFLLPFSALESDLSADNLMALAARLLAAARKEASRAVRLGRSADSMWDLPEERRRSMYEKLGRKYDDPEVKKALGRI